MSTKDGLKGSLGWITGCFLKDIEALPEEAFQTSMGGRARTAADLVYEVNLVADHVCLTLRGEPPFEWPEGWIHAPEGQRSKEAALASFAASSQRVHETLEGFSEEELLATIETQWGPQPRSQRLEFIIRHYWYHCGQLNFMQTLLGDDVWHWG